MLITQHSSAQVTTYTEHVCRDVGLPVVAVRLAAGPGHCLTGQPSVHHEPSTRGGILTSPLSPETRSHLCLLALSRSRCQLCTARYTCTPGMQIFSQVSRTVWQTGDRDPGHMCSEDNYHWLASLSSSSWLPRCDASDDEVVTPVITEPCVPPRVMIHNWSHDWELLAQDPARPRRSSGAGQELRKLTRPGPGLHHAHSVLRAHATSPALWLARTMWHRPLIGPAGMVMHWWTNFPANSRSLWSDRGGAGRGLTMCPVSARQWSLLTALATCHGKSCHFWNPAILRPGPILTGHTALSESIIIPNGSQTSPCQCINELICPPQ